MSKPTNNSKCNQKEKMPVYKPCELDVKPHRSYYKDDWRCDCIAHSQADYIKILNNVFQVNNAHFFPFTTFDGKQDDSFIVNLKDDLVLSDTLRNIEFHGLMLSSIHVQKGKRTISMHFKDTGWYE